jgi:uncharacterized protein YqjF (DUF2071 family)
MFKKIKLFNVPIPWFGNFEEINLRFYVVRKEGIKTRCGFINETIPYPIVAWMAKIIQGALYRRPTKHEITRDAKSQK